MMKKLLTVATIVAAMCGVALAQMQTPPSPAPKPMMGMSDQYLASHILGANVKNAADETIGDVKDLIISRENNVLQAVLSVGGFLGIGEKLVAIPYDKLQVGRMDDKVHVAYNATKAELEGMPTFAYKEAADGGMALRLRDLLGTSVKNTADDTIGEVKDLIITAKQNVPKALISVGGFLGVGDKVVAVPYDALQISRVDEKDRVVYNATKEELKAMPNFEYR
jgi:ribosomal 30S subunit maturation factor RimM